MPFWVRDALFSISSPQIPHGHGKGVDNIPKRTRRSICATGTQIPAGTGWNKTPGAFRTFWSVETESCGMKGSGGQHWDFPAPFPEPVNYIQFPVWDKWEKPLQIPFTFGHQPGKRSPGSWTLWIWEPRSIRCGKKVFSWGKPGKSPYLVAAGCLGKGSRAETELLFGKKSVGFTFPTWEKGVS